ncbi:MAG TPA: hypothetical protein VFU05_17455 [Cyclobacteriaceae bacterium]|nr:hypothetical protein [Cyclobacteriaceae bacterium]
MKTHSEHGTEFKNRDVNVISLWIDSYDDIFSDFDPRPFSERTISDDFVAQMKRLSRESRGKVAILKLLVPDGMQREEHEKVIKKRLFDYFNNISQQLRAELKGTKVKGLSFTLLGITLMIIASYISFLKLSAFSFNMIRVLFEPGGWFLFWIGLDFLISGIKSKSSEAQFYNRMEAVHVEFGSYK